MLCYEVLGWCYCSIMGVIAILLFLPGFKPLPAMLRQLQLVYRYMPPWCNSNPTLCVCVCSCSNYILKILLYFWKEKTF